MANGVLVFAGMRVGVLDGDLTVHEDQTGAASAHLVLSTAYNVLPLWLRIANDELVRAKAASVEIASLFSTTDDETKRQLLLAELGPSMQVAMACGVALDALFNLLQPYAKLSYTEKKTKRPAQIAETIKRVYKVTNVQMAELKQKIEDILSYRGKVAHPSFKLQRACDREDISVGVDWKFSLYRYSNARQCFLTTMKPVGHFCERKSGVRDVDDEMGRIADALVHLNLIKRNASS